MSLNSFPKFKFVETPFRSSQGEQLGAQHAAAAVPPVPVRHFVTKHNQIALLDETVRGVEDYVPIMQFLKRLRIAYAISENVQQVTSYNHVFWRTARTVSNIVEFTINGTPSNH
ncbi:hypothetical protein Hanom_Chr13g01211071 [Helianthus anomalus]